MPALGVGLLSLVFVVNILGNRLIQSLFVPAVLKVVGIAAFAIAGLWALRLSFEAVPVTQAEASPRDFLGGEALAIPAFKGFTTITNSGGEIVDPHRNVGRAIVQAIAICVVVNLLMALAVGSNLTIDEIVAAKDFALAEAAHPAFGDTGMILTVAFAVVATVSGLIASAFTVSRMLAMLTEMELVPHRLFGMPGDIQKHTLVYTIVAAMAMKGFFDLSRIAALGAILHIVMEIAAHWGILRHLRKETGARAGVLVTAIALDLVVLVALLWVKGSEDALVLYAAVAGMLILFAGERWFLRAREA